MRLTSTIRRASRGDESTLYSLMGILTLAFLLLVLTVAYTSTHNRNAPWIAAAVIAVGVLGLWRCACRRARRREQRHAAAAQAHTEAEWQRFLATFPSAARHAVTLLCNPAERAATFAMVGLVGSHTEIVHTRTDWGIWPTERGAAVRLSGLDPDAFPRLSAGLALVLGVPAVAVRRSRRRDGACELHLITR